MNRKKILEKRLARLMKKRETLKTRALASNDASEVRAINEQLEDLNEDIADVEAEIEAIDEDDVNGQGEGNNGGANGEGGEGEGADARSNGPTNNGVQTRGGNPMASFGNLNQGANARNVDVIETLEYRNAFATYVRTGQLSAEIRDNETLVTSDVGMVIPKTVMTEFIKEIKVYGNLYNKVRKLNVKGGVEFPIEELVATVTWLAETEVSETQKAPQIKTSISFNYHIVEARISQSLLSQVVTLDVLEKEIAHLLAEAFVKEFDKMILSGSGEGQPLGILNDTRIKASNKVKFTEAELSDWTKWRKKLFAIIPLAYRGQGVLVMTANTWESYCMTLKDANNNPLGTETFNVQNGDTVCRFAGKEVILVEPDILADFDTAESGQAFALYFKPTDYAINSNMQLGFKRYFNDDTNKWVNKGLAILDGKMLDVNSAYILTK